LPMAPKRTASLESVAAFIIGETDDERMTDLLWGLLLIDHSRPYPALSRTRLETAPIPRIFALLRLLFVAGKVETNLGEAAVRPEPTVLTLLKAGRAGEAGVLGLRRLRASGLVPMPHRRATSGSRDREWLEATGFDHLRLAAALLFPLNSFEVGRLAKIVTRPVESVDTTAE